MLDAKRKEEFMKIDFNDIDELRSAVSHKFNTNTQQVEPPPFPPTERFKLDKNEYYNSETIETTVGRYIVNRSVLRDTILKHIGYQNKVITDSVYKKDIDKQIKNLLLDDKITVRDFKGYVNRLENLTVCLVNAVTNSFTPKIMVPNEKVMKRKQELFEKYAEQIKAKDIDTIVMIEKELVELANKELEGDPGMDSYNSGARGSFASNYKELNIMKGPVYNSTTDEWDIIENCFEEGLAKKDLPAHGNSVVTGAYPKAVGTAVCGHISKQISAALETIVLDSDPKSDCGTKGTIRVFIYPKISEEFIGRTIKDKGGKTTLTSDNIGRYINTFVDMYSPMYCLRVHGGKICAKCGDMRSLSLGVTNIGIASTKASSSMLNMKMKQFHAATVKITKIDKDKLFL